MLNSVKTQPVIKPLHREFQLSESLITFFKVHADQSIFGVETG